MAIDVLQETLDILSSGWTSGNTDSLTPNFIKVTDQKRYDFNDNQDVVIAQRSTQTVDPAGTGDNNKHEFDKFELDVRVLGADQEAHFLNVIEEIKRIIDVNKINPFSGTISEVHILEFNGTGLDLSNKTHQLWRKMVPVQLERYNIPRT